MKILACSLDLTKIQKDRIKKHDNGSQYYDITVIINDEKNQYGQDVSIQQGQTKDERLAKVDRVYLGNGKVVHSTEPVAKQEEDMTGANGGGDTSNDLPF